MRERNNGKSAAVILMLTARWGVLNEFIISEFLRVLELRTQK